MYKRILMPTDGSASSDLAVTQGLELAKQLGAEVTFLHVLENPLTAGYATPETLPYAAELYQDLREAGAQLLERAKAKAAAVGVTANTVLVEHHDPVEAVHDAEADHDVVVMGTHGRRGFNRWMFGSVAEGALRRSTKPYLVVRAQDASE